MYQLPETSFLSPPQIIGNPKVVPLISPLFQSANPYGGLALNPAGILSL